MAYPLPFYLLIVVGVAATTPIAFYLLIRPEPIRQSTFLGFIEAVLALSVVMGLAI